MTLRNKAGQERARTVRKAEKPKDKPPRKVKAQDGKELVLKAQGGAETSTGNGAKGAAKEAQRGNGNSGRMQFADLLEDGPERQSIPKIRAALKMLGATLKMDISDQFAMEFVELVLVVPAEKREQIFELMMDRLREGAQEQQSVPLRRPIPGCSQRNPAPSCDDYARANSRTPEGRRSVSLSPLNGSNEAEDGMDQE